MTNLGIYETFFFLISVFIGLGAQLQSLPPPYDTAEQLPFAPHGWYANAEPLQRLIITKKVKTIIEVGCWLGQSTRHMASCLPADGKVYAVDHWLGSIEHQEGGDAWSPELPLLYEYFLSNVIHEGLTDKIIPIRMESVQAAAQLPVRADLIYIDAGHDTESVYADLVAWFPHLRSGGILCGDDWRWDTVKKAVIQFASERGFHIKSIDNFWYFKPWKNKHTIPNH